MSWACSDAAMAIARDRRRSRSAGVVSGTGSGPPFEESQTMSWLAGRLPPVAGAAAAASAAAATTMAAAIPTARLTAARAAPERDW